jgi:hypothetical protein
MTLTAAWHRGDGTVASHRAERTTTGGGHNALAKPPPRQRLEHALALAAPVALGAVVGLGLGLMILAGVLSLYFSA